MQHHFLLLTFFLVSVQTCDVDSASQMQGFVSGCSYIQKAGECRVCILQVQILAKMVWFWSW